MTDRRGIIGIAGVIGAAVLLGAADLSRSSPPPSGKTGSPKGEKRPAYRMPDDEVLRQVQPLWPELYAKLTESKEKDPKDFRERMERVGPVIEKCEQLRRNKNPGLADLMWETFHLGEECRELARQYHNAPDDKTRTALAAQMKDKLAQQVDLELKHRQFELAEFQKKIDKMGKELKEQSEHKDKLVAERLQRWTGKSSGRPSNPAAPSAPPSTVAMPPRSGDKSDKTPVDK